MRLHLALAMTLTAALSVTGEGPQLSPTMPAVMVGSPGLCWALAPNSPPDRTVGISVSPTGTLGLGEVTASCKM